MRRRRARRSARLLTGQRCKGNRRVAKECRQHGKYQKGIASASWSVSRNLRPVHTFKSGPTGLPEEIMSTSARMQTTYTQKILHVGYPYTSLPHLTASSCRLTAAASSAVRPRLDPEEAL